MVFPFKITWHQGSVGSLPRDVLRRNKSPFCLKHLSINCRRSMRNLIELRLGDTEKKKICTKVCQLVRCGRESQDGSVMEAHPSKQMQT